MIHSLQPKGREFESTYVLFLLFFFVLYFYLYSIRLTSFIIDVPRPLSNVLWIIIFKRLMRNAYTEPVCVHTSTNIYVLQNRIVYVIKHLKPLFLDLYFQFCKYIHASKLFVYLYLHLLSLFLRVLTENVYRTLDM